MLNRITTLTIVLVFALCFAAPAYGQATASNGAPVVAGPIPNQVSDNSANIWWEMSSPAASNLTFKYGTDPNNLTQTAQPHASGQTVQVRLNGLQPNTVYYYSVVGPDGKTITNAQFKTRSSQDARNAGGFQVTFGPTIEYLSDKSAEIAWTTNVPASSVVKYGTDPSQLTQTAQAPWGQTTHRVTIHNLQPGTRYYFRVESGEAQGSGKMANTEVATFTTLPQGQQAHQIVIR